MSTSTNCGCGSTTTTGCDCFGNGVVIPTGPDGANGLSAYDIWILQGNTGDYAAFLASLVGATGATGATGAQGPVGPAGSVTPISWTNLTLINGWTPTGLSNQTPQYSIDEYGILRFRGAMDPAARTNIQFADLSAVLTSNTRDHLGTMANIISNLSYFLVSSAGAVQSSAVTTEGIVYLETASHFYVLD